MDLKRNSTGSLQDNKWYLEHLAKLKSKNQKSVGRNANSRLSLPNRASSEVKKVSKLIPVESKKEVKVVPQAPIKKELSPHVKTEKTNIEDKIPIQGFARVNTTGHKSNSVVQMKEGTPMENAKSAPVVQNTSKVSKTQSVYQRNASSNINKPTPVTVNAGNRITSSTNEQTAKTTVVQTTSKSLDAVNVKQRKGGVETKPQNDATAIVQEGKKPIINSTISSTTNKFYLEHLQKLKARRPVHTSGNLAAKTSVTKTDSAHNSTKNNRILVNSTTLENKVSLDKTTPQTNIIKSETPLAVCSGNLSKSAVQKPVAQSSVKKRGHSESDAEKKVENPGGKIMKTETEKRVKPNITSIESETLKVESISQTNGKKHSNSTDHANHCGIEYIVPISGYHCSLCRTFYFDYPSAMHHCTLLSHKLMVSKDQDKG